MKTIKQARRDAKRLFRLCLVNGRLDEDRARLVTKRVIESKRRGSLLILSRFLHLVKLDHGQHTAMVESAIPLPAGLQADIQAGLARRYGQGIAAQFMQNATLIGGTRIRVGSDVYDGSVRGALEALEKSF
jgi:F-type H+-transporting ATPase subunit delta